MHRRDRKGRVIHTRVPEVLEEELKRLAESLRLPTSKIVRAAIEDALERAEAAEVDLRVEIGEAGDRLESWLKHRERRRKQWRKMYRKRHGFDDEDEAETPAEASEKTSGDDDEASSQGRDEDASGQAKQPEATTDEDAIPEGVVGFQSMRLARVSRCRLCDREMDRGAEAYLGVGAVSGPPFIVCPDCAP